MIYYLKLYLRDWRNLIPLILSLSIQIFCWVYILFNIKPSVGRLFLHYNIVFGVNLLGEWWKILYFPIGGLVVILVNFVASFLLYKKDRFVSWLLSFWALMINIFLLVEIYLLIRLNLWLLFSINRKQDCFPPEAGRRSLQWQITRLQSLSRGN